MKPGRYDAGHAIVYLNEMVFENYLPEDAPEGMEPTTAYQYEGPMSDGGTLIESCDFSRDSLVNGLIRASYSQTEEDAIKTHQIMILLDPNHEKADQYKSEWAEFSVIRQSAIDYVDKWLAE